MKTDWKYMKFMDCIEKIPNPKQVKKKFYQKKGKYPIVSQEKDLISGYYDDKTNLYQHDTPVIVFGDHTRVIKYVDFNFLVGADGVKILIPKDVFLPKFLFYYLTWYDILNLGYSRHFKLLKEIVIPVPPLSVQKSIVRELDHLNNIIQKSRELLAEYDKLAESLFYEMFGDPVKNNWKHMKLGAVCEILNGFAFKSKLFTDNSDYMPIIRIRDVKRGYTETYYTGSYSSEYAEFNLIMQQNRIRC